MIQVLGIENAAQIVPDKTSAEPMDPVAENMALLTSKPVKAFEWQDHQAHIQVHQTFMNDPTIKQALAPEPARRPRSPGHLGAPQRAPGLSVPNANPSR